ncbi:MAG TPA: hypothetical protein PKK63_06795, partial [Bacillota bacterium]|nr:hypothetical protein [Bacillota bacterium]
MDPDLSESTFYGLPSRPLEVDVPEALPIPYGKRKGKPSYRRNIDSYSFSISLLACLRPHGRFMRNVVIIFYAGAYVKSFVLYMSPVCLPAICPVF